MVLLSLKSDDAMFAELVLINGTLKSEEKTLSFALEKKFTSSHQIKQVCVDEKRQLAIFVTESHYNNHYESHNPIDSVTVLKMGVGAVDSISQKQVTIALPEKQVLVRVFCIYSDKEDIIDLYCLY